MSKKIIKKISIDGQEFNVAEDVQKIENTSELYVECENHVNCHQYILVPHLCIRCTLKKEMNK